MTEQNNPTDDAPALPAWTPADGPIVAKAYRNYRLTRYALVVFLFGYGLYSIRDGFFVYPRENADARAKGYEIPPHPGLDVPFNKTFGVLLPPLSIALLAWALYNSRGEFRFDGETLSAPGHPPVPITAVTSIDRTLWERKSIAYINYKLPAGTAGRIKIDHSTYDPIDKLFKQVEIAVEGTDGLAFVTPPGETPTA